jgi:hypothetical protein
MKQPPALTIDPPYTNRWGKKPGPNYRRCQGTTKLGEQCRRGAEHGHETCRPHRGSIRVVGSQFNRDPLTRKQEP